MVGVATWWSGILVRRQTLSRQRGDYELLAGRTSGGGSLKPDDRYLGDAEDQRWWKKTGGARRLKVVGVVVTAWLLVVLRWWLEKGGLDR